VAVNLNGAFLTCRWAARVMRAQGHGLITLTSSTAGIAGYPFRSPYSASKWAIIGLMKTLAMELGPAGYG
jgi:NAD(P)-dependent dehydrogenase (short-subunit alcohol dehydrogenase family)